MSTDTWKGKPRELFPEPTPENTEEISKDDFDKLLKTAVEVKDQEIEIPPAMLSQLRALDAEIDSRSQLRQGLWTGCALGLGIDIMNNLASFNHATGLITVTPNQA